MGYTTKFDGVLKFKKELTASQLAVLNEILGSDFRELSKEVQDKITKGVEEEDMPYYYYDMELTKDFTGLKWNGAEKTYGMIGIVNSITQWMRTQGGYKDFELTGSLHAQGEEVEDRWDLVMKGGVAIKVKTPPAGEKIQCPHCDEYFYYEGKNNKQNKEKKQKVFCITGTLSEPRKNIQAKIQNAGHKFTNKLSANVDFLVCGEKPGSKRDEAQKLGIFILSEKELDEIIDEVKK